MTCVINIKMGEGKDDFNYNFNNGLILKKISPSQEKRNFLRKQEHIKNKVKIEKELDEKENNTPGTRGWSRLRDRTLAVAKNRAKMTFFSGGKKIT